MASYVFMPLSGESILSFKEKGIEWHEGYKILFFISRPSLLLAHYEMKSIELICLLVSIIIPFILLSCFISVFIFSIVHAQRQKQTNSKQEANISASISLLFQKIISIVIITTSLYNFFMFIAFTDLLIVNAMGGSALFSNSFEKGTGIIFLCFLGIIVSVVLSLLSSCLLEQSMTIQEWNLNRTQCTQISTWINFLKFLTMVTSSYEFCKISSSTNTSQNYVVGVIIGCLVISYFFIQSIDFFTVYPFSSINKSTQYVCSLAICGFSSLFAPFSFLFKIISSKQLTCLCIIVLPLLAAGLSTLWARIQQYLLFEVFQREDKFSQGDMKYLQKKISLLYNNKSQIISQQYLKLIAQIELHQQTCIDHYCFCKSTQGLCLSQDETKFIIDEMQIERYLRHLCRIDLNREKNEREEFHPQFLRYMDFFSKSNKETYSVQCIIDFLNEQDRMHKDISVFKEQSLLTMLDVIKKQMKETISARIVDNEIEKAILQIDLYIQYEIQKDQLKHLLFDCLKNKVEAYEKMRKSFENISDLEQTNFTVNEKYQTLQKLIKKCYLKFPSRHIQSFLCFFLTEINSSFKQALDVSRQIRFTNYDSDFTLRHKNNIMDMFGEDVVSATVTMGKVWGKIQRVSDKLPQLLGYKRQEFSYINHIKEIMPPTVAKIHDNLIKYLMTTGQDNILHSRRDLFLKRKNNFLMRVQVYIAMNLHHNEELPFITFAKVLPTKSGFLVLNSSGAIEGIDSNVLEKFGFTGKLEITSLPGYLNLEIRQLLPNFDQFLNQIDASKNVIEKESVPFYFPNEQHPQMIQLLQYSQQQSQQQQNELKQKGCEVVERKKEFTSDQASLISSESTSQLQQKNKATMNKKKEIKTNLNKYEVDINIEKRDLHVLTGKYTYYVIEVKRASHFSVQNGEISKSAESLSSQTISSNNIKVPQDQCSTMHKPLNLNSINPSTSSKGKSDKKEVNLFIFKKDPQFLQKQRSNLNGRKEFESDESILAKSNSTLNQKENVRSIQQQNSKQNGDTQISLNLNSVLLSAKMNKKADKLSMIKVNKFFISLIISKQSKEDDIEAQHEISIKKKENINTNNESDDQQQTELSKEFSRNVSKNKQFKRIMQRQEGFKDQNEGSVASSSSSVSKNLDKYNFFEEFLFGQNLTFSMKLIGMIRLIEYGVLLLTTVIVILIVTSSFSSLNEKTTKLPFSYEVSFYYFNYLSTIDQFLQNSQTSFYQNVTNSFEIIHPRLVASFLNFSSDYREKVVAESLSNYFSNNNYLEFYEPYQSGLQIQNVTLLNALEQILFHFSHLEEWDAADWLNSNIKISSSYIFLHRNFLPFLSYICSLSSNLLLQDQKDISNEKKLLLFVTVILNVTTGCIYIISFVSFYNFEKSIQIVLKLIMNVTLSSVEIELERLRNMIDQLQESEETIITYQFNLKQTEKRALTIQQDKQLQSNKNSKAKGMISQRSKQNVSIQSQKMKISKFYLLAIISYIMFLSYSILNCTLASSLLSSFQDSLDFLKISSRSQIITPVLSVGQFLLKQRQSMPNLLTYDQYENLNQKEFQNQLNEAVEFQSQVQQIFILSSLSSASQNQYYELITENMCLSPPIQDAYFEQNCKFIYNSQLSNGAVSTLNLLSNNFQINQREDFIYPMDKDPLTDDIGIAAQMVSLQLKNSNEYLEQEILNLIQSKQQLLILISIAYLMLITPPQIYLLLSERPRIFERFLMSKRIILFIPPSILLVEDSFMKMLKAISNKLKITR